jgi:hypothetical protein
VDEVAAEDVAVKVGSERGVFVPWPKKVKTFR